MPLSILIVEDEFIIAEDIRAAILSHGYTCFGIAHSYPHALDLLKKNKPDFALVDITLDGDQYGLLLGKIFSEDLNIPYIYVTSHADTGTLEKVKLTGPSGYLLKPFRRESIYAAIEVALTGFQQKKAGPDQERSTIFKRGDEKIRVRYNEILFMESDGNYTHVQTMSTRFTERKSIKELLDELDGPFIRVHKSYAVNKNKIHHFTREKIFIGNCEIPIGRTYAEELTHYLHQ
jgi:DNA-binding LytR/AlgR family response regulator